MVPKSAAAPFSFCQWTKWWKTETPVNLAWKDPNKRHRYCLRLCSLMSSIFFGFLKQSWQADYLSSESLTRFQWSKAKQHTTIVGRIIVFLWKLISVSIWGLKGRKKPLMDHKRKMKAKINVRSVFTQMPFNWAFNAFLFINLNDQIIVTARLTGRSVYCLPLLNTMQ